MSLARRPEMMKRRCAMVAADERRREVVSSMSFQLVEEFDRSCTDVPEIVVPASAGRTLRRMPRSC
jgi:hypothetical protein